MLAPAFISLVRSVWKSSLCVISKLPSPYYRSSFQPHGPVLKEEQLVGVRSPPPFLFVVKPAYDGASVPLRLEKLAVLNARDAHECVTLFCCNVQVSAQFTVLISSSRVSLKWLSDCLGLTKLRLHATLQVCLCSSPCAKCSSFLDKNRHRARLSNDIIIEHQDTEKCLVTGDSATESPVHLCHVFPECHWTNHPLASRLYKIHLLRLS